MRALLLIIILLAGAYACKDNNLDENQAEIIYGLTSDETNNNQILVSEFTETLVGSYYEGNHMTLQRSDYGVYFPLFISSKYRLDSSDEEATSVFSTSFYMDQQTNYYLANIDEINSIYGKKIVVSDVYHPTSIEKMNDQDYQVLLKNIRGSELEGKIQRSELLYLGYITPLERIYHDTNNNIFFRKELIPIDSKKYYLSVSNKTQKTYAQNNKGILTKDNTYEFTLTDLLYPLRPGLLYYHYTNSQSQEFSVEFNQNYTQGRFYLILEE